MRLLVLLVAMANAYSFEVISGERKNTLIELYTSESCSSCPSAEKWLSRFKSNDDLWTRYIPVSFHVAYWNHLSWKDAFSKEEFSKRQRHYASKIKSGVYTPQIIVNGKDFRKSKSSLKSEIKVGKLSVSLKGEMFDIKFNPSRSLALEGKSLGCYIAFLGSNFSRKISSGENAGKTLNQDFVVLNLSKAKMLKSKNSYTCKVSLSLKSDFKQFSKAISAWVVDTNSWELLQAVGGKLN